MQVLYNKAHDIKKSLHNDLVKWAATSNNYTLNSLIKLVPSEQTFNVSDILYFLCYNLKIKLIIVYLCSPEYFVNYNNAAGFAISV